MKCKHCPNEALGYNVYFYHDYCPIDVEPACDDHSVAGLPQTEAVYDEDGYPIYRPDPTFLFFAAMDNTDDTLVQSVLICLAYRRTE